MKLFQNGQKHKNCHTRWSDQIGIAFIRFFVIENMEMGTFYDVLRKKSIFCCFCEISEDFSSKKQKKSIFPKTSKLVPIPMFSMTKNRMKAILIWSDHLVQIVAVLVFLAILEQLQLSKLLNHRNNHLFRVTEFIPGAQKLAQSMN